VIICSGVCYFRSRRFCGVSPYFTITVTVLTYLERFFTVFGCFGHSPLFPYSHFLEVLEHSSPNMVIHRSNATQTALPVFVSTNKSCTQKYNWHSIAIVFRKLLLLLLLLQTLQCLSTQHRFMPTCFRYSTIRCETKICVAGTLAGTIMCAKFQRGF